ncbi:MAG TPA: hypothetical protein VFI25_09305 [Planctomycetota bacterium]|jgi:hypothetical protein|nr:hypothetical protein [Planctomycetota bacterium]
MKTTSRRQFLGGIGTTMGSAAVGFALAERLGFAETLARIAPERLKFGALDPLVDLMQATPADALLPLVVERLRRGTPLADLVGAGALANARAYGGTNYNGYHALMAMMPSFEMAAQMPPPYAALPVLKVLHRNARFFQESGRAQEDALEPLESRGGAAGAPGLVETLRARNLSQAERTFAALEERARTQAYEELQTVVRDEMNVHRVVLAWRAYDLLRLTGQEHALTMLRQSVRFCIDEDGARASRGGAENEIRSLLPKLMEEHGLDGRERGTRKADEPWIERLSDTLFSADRATAARAAAAALAEGIDPEDVGAAMSLAATRLLLHDPGQSKAGPGKPIGSVHGASTGVHASDAANAWRHIARVGGARNAFASLIAGAYHTAGQSGNVGALPHDHDGEPCAKDDPAALLSEIDGRIRGRDQKGACQAARRYCALGHPSEKLFALLLGFAVSEDGALHAEKYFRTAQDEHASARAPHRGLYLVALTRVMASHFGFPAPGCEEARKLLAG